VARLVETRLAEALIDQVLRALMESRTLELLVIRLLERPEVSGAVDALVDRQVGRVLQALEKDDSLRQLVREQVDAYLKHLTEHPEPVRQLIQDQSRGMARDLQESVRAAAIDADDAAETWVHRMLGRS
jgi:phage I-like protein